MAKITSFKQTLARCERVVHMEVWNSPEDGGGCWEVLLRAIRAGRVFGEGSGE